MCCFCCYQLRSRSLINSSNLLQTWIQCRLLLLTQTSSLSFSYLTNGKIEIFCRPSIMLILYFLSFVSSACFVSWEWLRDGGGSFCSSYCWWYRGILDWSVPPCYLETMIICIWNYLVLSVTCLLFLLFLVFCFCFFVFGIPTDFYIPLWDYVFSSLWVILTRDRRNGSIKMFFFYNFYILGVDTHNFFFILLDKN